MYRKENDGIFLRVIRVNMRDLRKRKNTIIVYSMWKYCFIKLVFTPKFLCEYCKNSLRFK